MFRPPPRVRVPELMDDPALDPAEHARALAGLRRVNAVSRADALLWKPLRQLAREQAPKPLRVLDLATGSGDMPMRLWARFRKAGLPAEVAGCDISPVAVAEATRRAAAAGADVKFFPCDLFAGRISGEYDAVVCSLFMHHLDPPDVVTMLKRMAEVATRGVYVNDLRRSRGGWRLAWVGTRILSRSPVVHFDGPVSVAAAYTADEVKKMADDAGLTGATAKNCWPWRLLLSWRR